MGKTPDDTNALDPFGMMRTMRDTYMDAWSKSMLDLVSSKEYAEATGRMLDTYLTVSAPFRQALQATMTQVLTQLNMPTRTEVTSLAERLTNIEFRLDDLDAKIDALSNKVQE
jgi:polyhydroxyalkanoate synthesis regulator phasin